MRLLTELSQGSAAISAFSANPQVLFPSVMGINPTLDNCPAVPKQVASKVARSPNAVLVDSTYNGAPNVPSHAVAGLSSHVGKQGLLTHVGFSERL